MDVISLVISVALFAAGCFVAYCEGYEKGTTAMAVYYEVVLKTHDDLEDEE